MDLRDHGEAAPCREEGARGTRGLAALVLAAGASSRMRELKPLLPFAGSTVLERAVRTFLDAGVRDVIVVIGRHGDRLRPLLDALGVRWVVNPAPERGMYSSVVTGVSSLGRDIQGAFILPADMPAVHSRTVRLLAGAFRTVGAEVVYPSFRGRRGHPPLLARRVFAAVVEGSGEGGLRRVLTRFDEQACTIPVRDRGILLDLDTWPDYRAACADLGDPSPARPRLSSRSARLPSTRALPAGRRSRPEP